MTFDLRRHALLVVGVFWAALMVAVIAARPLTPVDETRYATVAWEMYQSGDLLSLRLNGALYGHKPPLMFWLIDLGWAIFGPNVWWPRLLSGLFGLGALALLARLAQRLAPGRSEVGAMALLITASSLYWMAFTGAVMFDLMLAFFVLLGVLGVAQAGAGRGWRAWLVVGAAIGLGILTKGPVALLHILPLALLGPWWLQSTPLSEAVSRPRWGAWYRGIGLAVLFGAAIALAWAVPSALAGGGQFGREIFWSQSVDRMVATEHHLRPIWFYLVTAPVLLLPWLMFPALWRGLAALVRAAPSLLVRFALAWTVPVFIGFSLFKGKQIQYLLPEVPAFALLAAAGIASLKQTRRWEALVLAATFAAIGAALVILAEQPRIAHLVDPGDRPWVWLSAAVLFVAAIALAAAPLRGAVSTVAMVAAASVAMVLSLYAGVGRAIFDGYDVTPISRHLAQAQQQSRPVAHFGKYHGQFQFAGRLQRPLEVVMSPEALLAWAGLHPEGAAVVYARVPLTHAAGARPQFVQKFKGRTVYVWRGADLGGVSDQWYRVADEDDSGGS